MNELHYPRATGQPRLFLVTCYWMKNKKPDELQYDSFLYLQKQVKLGLVHGHSLD